MKRLALSLLLLAPAVLAHGLEGYVYRADGTLVANAPVAAYLPAPETARREWVKKLTTDANGRFELTDLPDSLIEIDVEGTTHTVLPTDEVITITSRSAAAEPPPSRPAPQLPVTHKGDRIIEGTITLAKKPLRGVIVRIDPMSENASQPVTLVTDAKGRYRATGLAPARYMIQIAQGLELRLRTPWWNRMFDERRAPNVVDVEEQRSGTLDVDLTLAPIVSGRVTDHEKKPVAGAEVLVMPENTIVDRFAFAPSLASRTLPDGRFFISAPPFEAEQRVQVFVARPHHSVVGSKPFVFGKGVHNVDVTLPRFEDIPVRVTGADGQPVKNATVAFTNASERMYPEMSRIAPMQADRGRATNSAGEAVVHLMPGDYDFVVTAPRHQTKTLRAQTIKRGSVINVALEPSYTIRGRVHRRGKGVGGVHVMIVRERRDLSTMTDATGAFELSGLAKETYPLQFVKHDELINESRDVAAPADVDVELPPSGVIRGRVIDASTRESVREFMLAVEPLDAPSTANARPNFRRGPMALERNEQSDGTFTANVPVGAYRVTITAAGYTAGDPVEVRVNEEQPARVEIALDRGGTISGIVTDESGVPVREAAVWIVSEASAETPQRSSTMRNAPRIMPVVARTNASGAFTMSGIEPGPAILMVRREGFVPARRQLDVQGSMNVDVKLSRGLTVTGIVTRDGQPLAEAHVNASTAAVSGEHQAAVTDERGRFTMPGLIEARYTFSAFKEQVGHVEVPNIDVARQREIVIELESAPRATIYGTVTGLARTGAKVLRRAVLAQSNQHSAEGVVDDNGNYRIENAPTGTVHITAHIETTAGGRTSARKQVELAPRQEVRIDLDVAAAILVRGRITQEGKPVRNARAVFTTEAGVMSSTVGREDGTYELSLAEPGLYRIFVHGEDVRGRAFHTSRTIRNDAVIDLDVREQIVEGTVVDAESRQPIAGAIVTLAPQEGQRTYITGETITDAAGRFTMPVAVDGPHLIFVSARGYAYRMQPHTLGTTRSAPLTFELARTEELRVRVVDAKTRAPLAAHIVIADERGLLLPVRGEQTADAAMWVFSLPQGRYRATITVQGYTSKTIAIDAPGFVEITME